jgi:hypothetical protein
LFTDFPDSQHCIPLLTRQDDSETGSRIGGAPPEGVVPPRPDLAHYLMTLAVDSVAGLEVSIFLNFDFYSDAVFDGCEVLHTGDGLVSFLVHGPSHRGALSRHKPILSAHLIEHLPVIRDTWAERHKWRDEFAAFEIIDFPGFSLEPGEVGVTTYRHDAYRKKVFKSWVAPAFAESPAGWTKLGGTPFFNDSGVGADLHERLVGDGYLLFLQLNHFMEDATVSGSWPFCDNEFFVYVREATGVYEWAYFWGPLS